MQQTEHPSMEKGFNVVFEGQRYHLRVFRRYFYPIPYKIGDSTYVVYSDTGREIEINYDRSEDYGLDNPFNRMSLLRLARAIKGLQCDDSYEEMRRCRVTICTNKELDDPDTSEIRWIPFDPGKVEPLEERLKRLRIEVEWESRKMMGRQTQ
ncbi:MAG TPA: hypothetical protein VM050_12005 [Patescibacteria group bacterium]|nr:hypothetical protein [Patescibacteria group bacterium]